MVIGGSSLGEVDWDFWIVIFWNHLMDWLVSWLLVAWSVGYKEIGYSALLFHFQSYFVFTDMNVVPWRYIEWISCE
jgi:hypothetical protein